MAVSEWHQKKIDSIQSDSFIYILLKSIGIFKLRLKNQNQYVNDRNFSENNDDENDKDEDEDDNDDDDNITGTFFNNTKTISSISRPVARKNPCDLCISLTFLKRLSRNRMNEKRGSE